VFELCGTYAGDRYHVNLVTAERKPAGDLIGMGRPAEIAGYGDAAGDVEDLHRRYIRS
jgi:hypothetical protein